MTPPQAAAERRTERVRGLMLGLAIGESVGRRQHQTPVIAAGVSTQLAAFTLEGFIRAAVRMSHKGICNPPGVIWRAYRRWAVAQGVAGVEPEGDIGAAFTGAPDGWLREVPAIRERRGNSPTTVAALRSGSPGSPERPLNNSMGCQGLVRVLPLAMAAGDRSPAPVVDLARRTTALTHGSPLGLDVTTAAVTIMAACLNARELLEGVHEGANAAQELGLDPALTDTCQTAVGGSYLKGSLALLREFAPDKTGRSALAGGIYVAATYHDPSRFLEALEFAARAPDGDSVAAVAGALLGASHGASQLPVDLVSRHELAWALDTLARDAVAELTDSPGGSEYVAARDPHWWARYPGW